MICVALLACESRQPNAANTEAPTSKPAPAAVPAPILPVMADTTSEFVRLGERIDSVGGLPAVHIGGQTYRIQTSARPDRTRRLIKPEPIHMRPLDSADYDPKYDLQRDSIYEANGYGYDAIYTVQLLAPNGRPKFTTTLRKPDFAGPMGGLEHVAQSMVLAPDFLGYLPQFNALAFDVTMMLDETDDGGAAMLLLDAGTGKVRYLTEHNYYGDALSPDVLTPDGRTLLLGQEILHADGRHVPLVRKNLAVAGTVLLNDRTALVVYEGAYDPVKETEIPVRGANAHIIDLRGRELGSFRFHGTAGAIGYMINHRYLAPTRTHYLYDNTNQTLHLIPRNAPLQHRELPLRKLPRFRPPQRPGEVRCHISPEAGGELTLYVDRTTGAVRYRLQQYGGDE
ncbi:hypothetical protein B0919_08495 [Hymenobacter sp. CRA2]|nr:hypothetical protein B0919_08495 [Hymenobacter sp. CRA2]